VCGFGREWFGSISVLTVFSSPYAKLFLFRVRAWSKVCVKNTRYSWRVSCSDGSDPRKDMADDRRACASFGSGDSGRWGWCWVACEPFGYDTRLFEIQGGSTQH
jgi:hypothetical protein